MHQKYLSTLSYLTKIMKVDTYPMFKIFSVAYYYSIIFGWMPIHVPKNAKDRENKSSWCIPGIISSIFFIIILVGSSDMTNRLRQITKFRGNISSSNLTVHDRIQIIAGPIFIHSLTINQLFIIVTFVAMPYHLLELRKTFDLFNYFFNRHGVIIGIEAKMNTIVYRVNMELILLIILNFLLSIASVLGSFNRMRLSFFLRFLISADNVLKKMEAFSICVQFWCVSSTLAKCFKCLNDSLSRLHVRKNQATATPPGLFLVPDPYTSPANMVIFLKHIKNAHVDLCSIIDQVNNVYQVLNLLSIIITLLSLLPHLFVFAITMAFSNFRMTPHISLILWPVQYFMKMLITCRIASIATSEAKRTETLLKSEIHKNLTAQEKCETFVAVAGYLVIIVQSCMTVIEEQYSIHERPTADTFDE